MLIIQEVTTWGFHTFGHMMTMHNPNKAAFLTVLTMHYGSKLY